MCIRWTVTGKVSDVIRTNGSSKPDLHFDYDDMGQRIAKTVTNKNVTTGDKFVTTYYVRNPQGSVMAVYEHKHGDSDNGTFTLAEQHLYGAGRLGMRKRDLALNATNTSETPATYYELTNHLGNVMAVISDKASTTSEPTVVSLSDYYPFGMTEPGRSYSESDDYRYGYTGHEKENDLAEGVYITEYRLLDTRLGRWMSVDPLAGKNAMESPYEYCSGNPIIFWDSDGRVKCKEDGTLDINYDMDAVLALMAERYPQNLMPKDTENDEYYSNDGIYARNIVNSRVTYERGRYYVGIATTTTITEDGEKELHQVLVMTPVDPNAESDAWSNCSGLAMLGGQAAFYTPYEAEVMLNDEYKEANGEDVYRPGAVSVSYAVDDETQIVQSQHYCRLMSIEIEEVNRENFWDARYVINASFTKKNTMGPASIVKGEYRCALEDASFGMYYDGKYINKTYIPKDPNRDSKIRIRTDIPEEGCLANKKTDE